MKNFIAQLEQDFPSIRFSAGRALSWSPKTGEIFYPLASSSKAHAEWGLLHEVGHALLDHGTYANDADLLSKEAAAWQEAQKLGQNYNIHIDDEHIQSCLDTYRNWLYAHSLCPQCHLQGLQKKDRGYLCLNCGHSWRTGTSRFCRAYRRHTA